MNINITFYNATNAGVITLLYLHNHSYFTYNTGYLYKKNNCSVTYNTGYTVTLPTI